MKCRGEWSKQKCRCRVPKQASAGTPGGAPVNLGSVVALARQIGFTNQFRINLPKDEGGVYSISADSMDGDTENPWSDRTIHVDQYTGKILAEIKFADYSLGAKSMAVGTALHQGDLGLWNTILNTVFCLAIIFLTVSGVVMWWLRRPKGVNSHCASAHAGKSSALAGSRA